MLEMPPKTVQDRLRGQLTKDLIRLWNLEAWRVLNHRVDRDEVSELWRGVEIKWALFYGDL